MLIYTQSRKTLINSNHVSYFDVDLIGDGSSNSVYANFENDAPICIGTFITKEEACNVLDKIAEVEGAINVFYVSKEDCDENN